MNKISETLKAMGYPVPDPDDIILEQETDKELNLTDTIVEDGNIDAQLYITTVTGWGRMWPGNREGTVFNYDMYKKALQATLEKQKKEFDKWRWDDYRVLVVVDPSPDMIVMDDDPGIHIPYGDAELVKMFLDVLGTDVDVVAWYLPNRDLDWHLWIAELGAVDLEEYGEPRIQRIVPATLAQVPPEDIERYRELAKWQCNMEVVAHKNDPGAEAELTEAAREMLSLRVEPARQFMRLEKLDKMCDKLVEHNIDPKTFSNPANHFVHGCYLLQLVQHVIGPAAAPTEEEEELCLDFMSLKLESDESEPTVLEIYTSNQMLMAAHELEVAQQHGLDIDALSLHVAFGDEPLPTPVRL